MSNTLGVTIIQTQQHLFEYPCSFFFAKEFFFNNFVEEFTAFAKLGDQVNVLVVFKIFVQLKYVRMIQLCQDSNLLLEPL